MDIEVIQALYDHDERRMAMIPGMRREEDGPVVRLVMEAEDEGKSYITFSDLDDGNADEIIARQVEYFRALRQSFEWKTFAQDRPADLEARLAASGLEANETEALLVLELDDAPERLLAPVMADVRRLEDPAQLETVRRLLAAVWDSEFAWFPPRMERFMRAGDFVSIYLAYVEGEPASAGWIFLPPGSRFASLYGGSTLAPHRGRGLYTALVAARAQEATERGFQFLTIDAGDMSRPIVEKQGFRLLATTTPYMMAYS